MSVPSSNRREHDAAVLAEALRNGTVDPRERTLELRTERDALRAQLQAVRDLHQPGPVLEGEFIRRDGTRTNRLQDTRCQTCKIESPCLTFIAASAPGVGAAQTRTEDE